mgnify:CR=1 FL=1
MAVSIALSGGIRNNLLSLQQTSNLISSTQARLSSGLKVASPIDDASAFFTAANARGRAADLTSRKNEIGESIQAIKAASDGIDAISKLIDAAKGIAESARSATTAGRSTLALQFNEVLKQIDQTATDSKYKGTNLLALGGELVVKTNETGTSKISINGFDASSTVGLAVSAIAVSTWTVDTALDAAMDADKAIRLAGALPEAVELKAQAAAAMLEGDGAAHQPILYDRGIAREQPGKDVGILRWQDARIQTLDRPFQRLPPVQSLKNRMRHCAGGRRGRELLADGRLC